MAGSRLPDDDLLAGLQGIPKEQYEAASIDGAGRLKSFLYVTLPGLKNVIKYVIMITVIQAMKLFTQPYVMTKAAPRILPGPWYITCMNRASRSVTSDMPVQWLQFSSSLWSYCHWA